MSIHLEMKVEETRKEVVQLWLIVEPLERLVKEQGERIGFLEGALGQAKAKLAALESKRK